MIEHYNFCVWIVSRSRTSTGIQHIFSPHFIIIYYLGSLYIQLSSLLVGLFIVLCTYFLFAQLLDRSLKGNVCWCCHAHTLKHKCTAIHPFGNSKWPLRDRSARKNFKTLILASEANRALLQNYLHFFPRFSSLWHAKKLMGGPNFFLSEYFEGLSHWKHYVWFSQFWSHFHRTIHCLPQRLKSMAFGTAPIEKISNNVDFSLWGNSATTQNTFFDIFK